MSETKPSKFVGPTPKEVVVLRLRCVARKEPWQIAEILGLSASALSMRLARAKTKLVDAGIIEEDESWDDVADVVAGLVGKK